MAKECRLSKHQNNYPFSGTDNDIISMSTIVSFKLDRLKSDSKLYDYLKNLKDVYAKNNEDRQYVCLPKQSKSSILLMSTLAVFTGRLDRNWRDRKRKGTEEGKEVLQIECKLSKSPATVHIKALSDHHITAKLHCS